jgi:hypothetical protein
MKGFDNNFDKRRGHTIGNLLMFSIIISKFLIYFAYLAENIGKRYSLFATMFSV